MKTFYPLLFVLFCFLGVNCKKDSIPLQQSQTPTPRPIVPILQAMNIDIRLDTLSMSKQVRYKITGSYSDGSTKDLSDSVSISSSNDKVTINQKTVIASKKGESILNFNYKAISLADTVFISEVEFENIDPRFNSTDNYTLKVPIVIINYFPTKDGINHDESKGPSSYWQFLNPTLDKTKTKVKDDHVLTKKAIEYGTRFRDYGTGTVNPYIRIEVIKYINVYELDLMPWVNNLKTPDYRKLFDKLNIRDLVNNKGVKEIWMTIFPKDAYPSIQNSSFNDPTTFYNMNESNMSSPTSGDISNSHFNQNDLPIYNSTYVVYGNSGHRGVGENLHNRGHQIEAQLRYIDKTRTGINNRKALFDDAFIGCGNSSKDNYQWLPFGRVGMTHFPPNTSVDYDYNNKNSVLSDIANWKPSGGERKLVNADTWLSVKYNFDMTSRDVNFNANYDTDPQTKWLLYWFQSIPGLNNNIDYTSGNSTFKISNWWDIFYNWDNAIRSGKTLWE